MTVKKAEVLETTEDCMRIHEDFNGWDSEEMCIKYDSEYGSGEPICMSEVEFYDIKNANNVSKLPPPKPKKDDIKAWRFTQRIDECVVKALSEGLDPNEIAVLLADRTGAATFAAWKAIENEGVFTSLDNFTEFVVSYLQARVTTNGEKQK